MMRLFTVVITEVFGWHGQPEQFATMHVPDSCLCPLMLSACSYSKARPSPITIDRREEKDDKTKMKDRYRKALHL